MKLPKRLVTGRFVIGPDYHGCSNTGFAPALLKSKMLAKWTTLSRGFRFAVGPHLFVEDAVVALLHTRVPEGRAYHERDGKRSRVRFFKTYASAKKHFAALVVAAEAANAEIRAKEQALCKRAVKGDLDAAVALLDY